MDFWGNLLCATASFYVWFHFTSFHSISFHFISRSTPIPPSFISQFHLLTFLISDRFNYRNRRQYIAAGDKWWRWYLSIPLNSISIPFNSISIQFHSTPLHNQLLHFYYSLLGANCCTNYGNALVRYVHSNDYGFVRNCYKSLTFPSLKKKTTQSNTCIWDDKTYIVLFKLLQFVNFNSKRKIFLTMH